MIKTLRKFFVTIPYLTTSLVEVWQWHAPSSGKVTNLHTHFGTKIRGTWTVDASKFPRFVGRKDAFKAPKTELRNGHTGTHTEPRT